MKGNFGFNTNYNTLNLNLKKVVSAPWCEKGKDEDF